MLKYCDQVNYVKRGFEKLPETFEGLKLQVGSFEQPEATYGEIERNIYL